ncbi:hypothetical protein QUC31_019126 [Theobroma cacao]
MSSLNEAEARRRYALTACDAPLSVAAKLEMILVALETEIGVEERILPVAVFIRYIWLGDGEDYISLLQWCTPRGGREAGQVAGVVV